jgi:hypothetical protein
VLKQRTNHARRGFFNRCCCSRALLAWVDYLSTLMSMAKLPRAKGFLQSTLSSNQDFGALRVPACL